MNYAKLKNKAKKYVSRSLIFLFITGFVMILIGAFYSGPTVEIADFSFPNPILGLGFIFFIIPLLIIGLFYLLAFIGVLITTVFSIFPFLDDHPVLSLLAIILAVLVAVFLIFGSGEEYERIRHWPFVR